MTIDDFIARVPYWNAKQPKFIETLKVSLEPLVQAAAVTAKLPQAFDLDTAIGSQLDVVGEWIGRSREVLLPIPGVYFSFNDPMRGFGQGVWKGPFDTPVGITNLDDETYRRLLRANILAKHWDGTIPGAQAAFDAFFLGTGSNVFVQDNAQVPFPLAFFSFGVDGLGFGEGRWYQPGAQDLSAGKVDVSMTIGISGKTPAPVLLGLLAQNGIPIKPGGVQTNYAISTVNNAPLFGFGVQNQYVSGFGTGAWGATPEHILGA